MTGRRPFDAWLDARTPPPPPALAARMRDAVTAVADRGRPSRHLAGESGHAADIAPIERPISALALDAGVQLLASVLRGPAATRAAALDLLAADALVTYAFESAADERIDLNLLARDAMTRIARLAGSAPA
jgi:hypothetical protein